jgi:coenzyme F420-reducing hydrogenase delta subunit
MRRAPLLKKLLGELGVEELRFRLKWIAASEPSQFARTVNEMTEEIRKLGPFKRKKKGAKRSAA